jgi:3-dehydroquinate synthase
MANVGLPTDLSRLNTLGWTVDKLMNHMSRDKKVEGGKLTFILARGIGQSYITQDVAEQAVRDLLARWLANTNARTGVY